MQVAPAERLAEGPASQVAVPLAGSEHCVQAYLWREFHVLQHHLQGNVANAWAAVSQFTERHMDKDKETVENIDRQQNIELGQKFSFLQPRSVIADNDSVHDLCHDIGEYQTLKYVTERVCYFRRVKTGVTWQF